MVLATQPGQLQALEWVEQPELTTAQLLEEEELQTYLIQTEVQQSMHVPVQTLLVEEEQLVQATEILEDQQRSATMHLQDPSALPIPLLPIMVAVCVQAAAVVSAAAVAAADQAEAEEEVNFKE
jgi:hypothetical protein